MSQSATSSPGATQERYESGVVDPRWTVNGYSATDLSWVQELQALVAHHATWVEMPLLFHQKTAHALIFDTSRMPSVQSLSDGIVIAHAAGLQVFLVPLITVDVPGGWAGMISFDTTAQLSSWFDAFWAAYQPYVRIAQSLHVEQVALGTELSWVQQHAPDRLWQTYIGRVSALYHGVLTYNSNWSVLRYRPAPWMHDPRLSMIGISEYIPLVQQAVRIAPSDMPMLWKRIVQTQIDTFALQLGKPVLLSEIGYRNSFDALYQSWDATHHAGPDEGEQASATQAALSNVAQDPLIRGTFWWGWNNTGPFDLHDTQAAGVISSWYAHFNT